MENTSIFAPDLQVAGGQVTTTSMQIAKHFGKRHDRVLRAIENMHCSEVFRYLNFGETVVSRENPSNGASIDSKAYVITRDGFSFLAMGFTGKKAAQWKEAYITAFSKMEDVIREDALRNTIPATLYEQALQVETREARSFALAQAGSHAMLLRKSEKKELVETVELMREAIQLRLALGYSVTV